MKNHKSRRIGRRAYPLRKIVMRNVSGNYKGIYFERLHRLECGHEVPPVHDIYGECATTSMRCRICYDEKMSNDKNVQESDTRDDDQGTKV